MTITESVRGLTIGDCPTRREAVKTIRKYCEAERKYHKAVDEYREAVKKYTLPISILDKIRAEIEEYREIWRPTGNSIDNAGWRACNKCIEIIDKCREAQAESEE